VPRSEKKNKSRWVDKNSRSGRKKTAGLEYLEGHKSNKIIARKVTEGENGEAARNRNASSNLERMREKGKR